MNNIQRLYKALVEQKLLNISFDDFSKYYENDSYKQNVFSSIKEKGLFDGDFEKFSSMYSKPEVEPKDGGFFEDLISSVKQGLKTGQSVEEGFDVFKHGKNISDDQLQEFINANNELAKIPETNEAFNFRKSQKENGGGVWGTLKAIAENPGFFPQFTATSLATMGSSLFSSEEVAAATGAGAGVGSAIPVVGTVAGGYFGLTTAMETGLTISELIKDELNGKEFNKENVKLILEDEKKFNKMRTRAVARGAAIGAFETVSLGLSRGVGAKILAKSTAKPLAKSLQISGATTAIEATGGFTGEVAGQAAAGQEIDLGEATLEGIGEAKGIVNVSDIIVKAAKPPKYIIRGESRSKKEIQDLINSEDITSQELAKLDLKVENDNAFANEVNKKQSEAYNDTQIDQSITDVNDRKKLVELEQKRFDLNKKAEKKGIQKVPNAANQLTEVEAEIESIIGKYEGAVKVGESQVAKDVRKARTKISQDEITSKVKKTKAYKDMDIETEEVNSATARELFFQQESKNLNSDIAILEQQLTEEKDSSKVSEIQSFINEKKSILADLESEADAASSAQGFLLEDNETGKLKIVINEDVNITADGGNINVAAHEFLHAVLQKTFFKTKFGVKTTKGAGVQTGQSLVKQLLSTEQGSELLNMESVRGRLKEAYGLDINEEGNITFKKDINEDLAAQEVMNVLSDAFVNTNYNAKSENFLVKLGQTISEYLQAYLPAKYAGKLNFKNGKQVFDFVKTFNRAVAGDKVAGRIISRASKEGIDTKTAESAGSAAIVAQKSSIIQEKVDGFALNEDGSKMTKQEYDAKGAGKAYMYLIADQNIDVLIKNELIKEGIDVNAEDANVNNVPLDRFIERVRELLIPAIIGFDPSREVTKEGKFGLSGFVNKRIAWRVGDASKKKEVGTSSLDKEISGDGKMTAADFVADEQDAMIEDFESRDQSIFAEPTEERGVVKSEYRRKLKRKDGKKFIAEQQEEDIRQGVRDVVKSQKTEISEKDFMLKFENNVKKKMKNIVQQAMGSGKSFIDFVYDNIDVILEYSTIQDLVAMERLVGQKFPEGKRIFSFIVKKNISPTEVDDAINKGKMKPDVGRNTGPDLYEKRKPTKAEVEAFFLGRTSDGQTMADVLNYEIGRSTRGTRKDGLSRMMISTLALDAVMETVQEPAVLQDAMIFSPNIDIEVQLQDLAIKVNRGVNTQFSRAGETQVLELQKLMFNKGRLDASISDYVRDNNVPKKVLYAAYEGHMSRRADKMQGVMKLDGVQEIFNRIRRKKQFKTVDPKTGKLKTVKLEGSEKVHTTLERIVIENLVSAIYSGKTNKNVSVILAAPMEGGMPDAYIKVDVGGTSSNIGIEVKGQISKTPSKNVNFKIQNGKLVEFSIVGGVESIGQKNHDIIEDMFKKRVIKLFNKDKYKEITKNLSTEKMTQAQYEMLRDSGLKGELASMIEMVELDYAQQMYLKKKIPSQYIDVGIKGTLHFGEDVLEAGTNPFTFEGDERRIPLSARFGFSRSRSKANLSKPRLEQEGRLILRFEGELNEGLFDKQDIKLKEPNGAKKLVSNIPFSKINAKQRSKNQNTINDAYNKARLINADTKAKGISIFDFDETVGVSENFVIATKGKETKRIASDEWPFVGDVLASEGWNFDFTDFNKVTKGKPGPLMQKLKNQIKKYGAKDVYILTARAPESQKAIHDWLKTQGINLPYENITGLGNSTGDAKAMWILDKYANEGYNDIYFVDDAIPNVEAVKHVMDQLDIKSKSVQARIQFSKGMSAKFNIIIQQNKDVDASKMFSDVSAGKFGKRNNPFRFFVPPSADDFLGLLRYFVGKGKVGEAQMEFFKKALIDPFARAYKEMNSAKIAILNDYKELMKQFPDVKKKLGKLIPESEYTYDNAVRVYLFNKAGHDIPGLSDKEVTELSNVVTSDPELLAFAETLSAISRVKEGYAKPSDTWSVENVAMDMQNAVDKIGRAKYLEEWQANVDEIFNKDNMNKIEAVYGNDVRVALEDMLYAMKTGRSRPQGSNKIANAFMNWINNSVGAIMFFNARSAVLQLISIVNFTNFEENNIFAQAKMFANQKQFWSDFSFVFNSDYLKARRSGLKMNINEAELQNAVAGATNKALAALRYILSLGFTPTQVADSIAIAFGGANFYRSKIDKYLAEGMSQKEAQEKAFLDFQEIAEETQQSARPDKISQQQRSVIGRIVLNFANTPLQMARLTKKAAQDLIAGRGSWKANVSRILYYGFVQNLIFSALQQAIFAIGFDEEEDDEKKKKKQDTKVERIFNGALDSLLRGSGIYGAVIATVKNTAYKFIEERDKGFKGDLGNVIVEAINLSPSIGSKFRKLYSAMKNDKFNKHVYDRMGYDTLENPVYQSISLAVEGTTNIPINRMLRKIDNLKASTDSELHALQRIFVFLGWDQWSLGIDSREEVDKVKDEIKQEKKDAKKEKVKKDKTVKKQETEKQYELDQKKERKDGKKNITCSGAKSDGTRCTRKPIKNGRCTIHEKVEIHPTGKYIQCRKRKADGNRCKMQTNSKSGFCYYHD